MADVIVAEHAGACFGVNRALEQVYETLSEAGGAVCTLGPLIHNPVVVAELAEAGAHAVSTPVDASGSTLVLRTHGVTPDEEALAHEVCARVVDATCPFVSRVHKSVTELADAGYQVVIVGEAGHPEVEGTRARVPNALVVDDARGLAGIEVESRVGVVAQTTQTRDTLRGVIDALLAGGRVRDLRVIDTICAATDERQRSAAALASRVEVMVVVGGRASANTSRLAAICAERAVTRHVESARELKASWFDGVSLVGVTAGASTPQSQIDEVVAMVRALVGE